MIKNVHTCMHIQGTGLVLCPCTNVSFINLEEQYLQVYSLYGHTIFDRDLTS